MPLDPINHDPLYLIGRLAALSERGGQRLGEDDLALLTVTPAAGLGQIGPRLTARHDQDEIADVMALLAAETVPAGPLKIEAQGPYWLGYYQQRAALAKARTITPERLRQIGETLWGSTWQTEMARSLDLADSARVREWLRGARRVPGGVAVELMARLRQQSAAARALATDLEQETWGPSQT